MFNFPPPGPCKLGRVSASMEHCFVLFFLDCVTRLSLLWSYVTILKEFILKSICFHLKEYLQVIVFPDLKPVSMTARPISVPRRTSRDSSCVI